MDGQNLINKESDEQNIKLMNTFVSRMDYLENMINDMSFELNNTMGRLDSIVSKIDSIERLVIEFNAKASDLLKELDKVKETGENESSVHGRNTAFDFLFEDQNNEYDEEYKEQLEAEERKALNNETSLEPNKPTPCFTKMSKKEQIESVRAMQED